MGVDFHKGAKESAVYPRVSLAFVNHDPSVVRITRYRVIWTAGNKQVDPRDLLLQPGEQRSVELIIYPGGGDSSPTDKDTTVEWTAVRQSAAQ